MKRDELRHRLEGIEDDTALLEPDRLMARCDALDWLEMLRQGLDREGGQTKAHRDLRERAQKLQEKLAATDERQFSEFRAFVSDGRADPVALRRLLDRFTAYRHGTHGYLHLQHEGLDVLLSSTWETAPAPAWPQPRDPDQVHYEPAPASVILELVDRLRPSPEDLFYDLGSGLGRVVILYHLLTGYPARGIEIEPALCAYARSCALSLGLAQVGFVCADARHADLSRGSLFFLFTPFMGETLQSVLRRLQRVAQLRRIAVCSYGPSTPIIAKQAWLQSTDGNSAHEFRLAVFHGR